MKVASRMKASPIHVNITITLHASIIFVTLACLKKGFANDWTLTYQMPCNYKTCFVLANAHEENDMRRRS